MEKGVQALQGRAGQACCAWSDPAKPGSAWPRSTDRLSTQSPTERSSWQASPSYWRWWLALLASWRALLGG